MTRDYTCPGCRAEYAIPAGVTVACPECGSRERETRDVVLANHTDSVRITRPDGTVVQIPAACVLAADAVFRRCVESGGRLCVLAVPPHVGWHAAFSERGEARSRAMSDESGTPWAALVSLAAGLAKAEGQP